MFSTIVVGTDGSATAVLAVAQAAQLARHSGATLHLVAAFQMPAGVCRPRFRWPPWPVHDERRANERGAADARRAGGRAKWPRLRIARQVGAPAAVIVRHAEEVEADLIVVGSKGMQGARRIIGSVPNTVAHSAGCHVLIAKTS